MPQDEATASTDSKTDRQIQKVVREAFDHATRLTIARASAASRISTHSADRLGSIVDADLILVVDEGRIVETGKPADLLEDDKSRFHQLCSETGDLDELKRVANGGAAEGDA